MREGGRGALIAVRCCGTVFLRLARPWQGVVALVAFLVVVLIAALALRLAPPRYTASMTVGPVARSSPAAMGQRSPSVPPQAGRGISDSGGANEQVSDFSRYLTLLTAMPVAVRLAEDTAIMSVLFADDWDQGVQHWRPPGGAWAAMGHGLRRLAGQRAWVAPDASDLSRLLKRRLVVQTVGNSPMQRLIFRHQDGTFAARLLLRLHEEAEAHLREEAARRLTAEMRYVESHLPTLSNVENSRAMTALLAEQERLLLMLNVGLPYAADMIEPPYAPRLADWPDPAIMAPAAAAVSAALVALALAFARTMREGGQKGHRERPSVDGAQRERRA
jgi:uncharacterized protein involved in exopolysaccharide biosynthesis